MIANPEFFEDAPGASPLSRAAAVGDAAFEIWTTDRGYLFDGVLVAPASGAALREAAAYRDGVWRRRYWEEVGALGGVGRQWGVAAAGRAGLRVAAALLGAAGPLRPKPPQAAWGAV